MVDAAVEGRAVTTAAAVEAIARPVARAKEVVAGLAKQAVLPGIAFNAIGTSTTAQNIASRSTREDVQPAVAAEPVRAVRPPQDVVPAAAA